MKKEKVYRSELPLADMHVDGIRFEPKIFEALKNQRAGSAIENEDALKTK